MENVKDVNGFWNFTENDLLDGLYSEEWYNQGTQYPQKSTKDKAWAVYMYDVWKIKTSMPEKDFLRSNNPSCEW